MEDEPQLDTVLRAIDNNTWHAKRREKEERNGIQLGSKLSTILSSSSRN